MYNYTPLKRNQHKNINPRKTKPKRSQRRLRIKKHHLANRNYSIKPGQ